MIEIISDIEGIGPVYGEKLFAVGINTLKDLRSMNIADVAEKTGISITWLKKWQEMSVLQRIEGIDHQISEVLVEAKINNIPQFIHSNPHTILEIIKNARVPEEEYNKIPDDYYREIKLADVLRWQHGTNIEIFFDSSEK